MTIEQLNNWSNYNIVCAVCKENNLLALSTNNNKTCINNIYQNNIKSTVLENFYFE